MTHLDAVQAKEVWKDEDEGDVEQALTSGGEYGGSNRLADGLQHHVGDGGEGTDGKGYELPTKCGSAYSYNVGVAFAEQGDYLLGKGDADDGT